MSAVLQQAPPPARSRHRFAFLVKPGWLGAIAGALAFTAACWLILAPWQFSRNTETSQTNAGIETAHHATPVPLEKYLSTARQPAEESVWQPVTATGTFLPDRMFYVRLRQDDGGNPVSEVVLPMRLTDGTVLLVDAVPGRSSTSATARSCRRSRPASSPSPGGCSRTRRTRATASPACSTA
jgi:cytochrome oxidase assembly protein ShyY1